MTKRREFVLALGVLVLAAGLRLWRIASLPPGLFHDEAYHLLQAQAIVRGAPLPIFITGNNGYEPLMVYLSVLALCLLGPVNWAGRLMTAWAGLLGVACTVRAGKEMFPRTGIGGGAGLALAGLVWPLVLSHFGSQPILTALVAAGMLAALWHGARTGKRGAYWLTGVCLGVGLYTHQAFRLFPVVPLAAVLALLVFAPPEQRRQRLAGGVLAALAAVLVFAPLGWFFVQNPQWFFNRFSQTTEGTLSAAAPAAALWVNALKTIGGLFFVGDANWRHNLGGRPALDAVQAFFFLVGVGVCLWRWRRPESWGLLVWLFVGLAPSMLTIDAPHFGRMVMATPAIALLMAVGGVFIWNIARRPVTRGLVIGAVALSLTLTVRDFFWSWAQDSNLYDFFEVHQTHIARVLLSAPPGAALYAPPPNPEMPSTYWPIEFLLGPETVHRLVAFNGQACSVIPVQTPAGGAVYAVETPYAGNTPLVLQAAFTGVTSRTVELQNGISVLDRYQVPPGQTAHLAMAQLRQADFGGLVNLVGYTLTPQAPRPGSPAQLSVVWETKQAAAMPYKVFIHLLGAPKADGSPLYAQYDTFPCGQTYMPPQWLAGQLLLETYPLTFPADLPPGDYMLQIGWYDEASGARLSVTNADGQPAGDAFPLERLRMEKP